MSALLGTLSPILLSSTAAHSPLADPLFHLQWIHGWLPSVGLLAMGIRGFLGGDDDEGDGGVAGDDDFLEGDELGDSFAETDDGFDDDLGDDADDPLAEVEPRISDLEADIEELSQTVTSIHGEHETMRESVDDIEENVRKLLEVYEVVTQGANPFTDNPAQAASGGGAFGLLEADDGGDEDGIDAEGLFDDAEDVDSEDDLEEAAEVAIEADDDAEALSFDDLKSEFEFVGDEGYDEGLVPDDAQLAGLDAGDGPDRADGAAAGNHHSNPDKPYLSAVPDGYGAELLVMEWLDFLVSESSMPDALRALRYYDTVDWIADDVAAHLQSVLSGMSPEPARAATDGGLPTELTVEHHTRSLEFISRLGKLDGAAGHPLGSPDETLEGIGLGRRDHGVQR